ncbi:hypothetical protein Stube_10600 [Streptomyces tubercidicus]|uniref:Uncharacterized protein n=1 Tax=Streptomyces tubercidicus TaxID=47759 RepID=A0A640UKR2_9ACTN|nr:hypothetical protein Stube_10600 [Streptomyces tubercidicus]
MILSIPTGGSFPVVHKATPSTPLNFRISRAYGPGHRAVDPVKTQRPERHAEEPPANLARTPGCTGEYPSAFLACGPLGWVTDTTYQVGRPSLR